MQDITKVLRNDTKRGFRPSILGIAIETQLQLDLRQIACPQTIHDNHCVWMQLYICSCKY